MGRCKRPGERRRESEDAAPRYLRRSRDHVLSQRAVSKVGKVKKLCRLALRAWCGRDVGGPAGICDGLHGLKTGLKTARDMTVPRIHFFAAGDSQAWPRAVLLVDR